MFRKASRTKLRFRTSKGYLSTEDLGDLTLQNLNSLAKSLKKKLREDDEEDFLEEKSEEDTATKLQFDIVLHVLETKKEENKARKDAVGKKAEKQKLMGALEKKQDKSLEDLSEEELIKKIDELN